MSFLIDIQQKKQEGKGGGYIRWAKVYNLKQKANAIVEKRDQMNDSMHADEARLQEIAILKTHKINDLKAKDTFQAYRASGVKAASYSQRIKRGIFRSVGM